MKLFGCKYKCNYSVSQLFFLCDIYASMSRAYVTENEKSERIRGGKSLNKTQISETLRK